MKFGMGIVKRLLGIEALEIRLQSANKEIERLRNKQNQGNENFEALKNRVVEGFSGIEKEIIILKERGKKREVNPLKDKELWVENIEKILVENPGIDKGRIIAKLRKLENCPYSTASLYRLVDEAIANFRGQILVKKK